ncbi:ferritin [Geomonas sp. Red276]
MDVFDCAIKMEKEARGYYLELASNAANEELKNLFSMLAQAEQEHHDALVRVKGSHAAPHKLRFTALDQAECLFKPLLEKRGLVAQLHSDPDAYRLVVGQEERGVRFYEELAARTEDEDARQVLLEIAREERKHLSIVENIYAFVESPKTFLAWGEFSNLKEY